MSMEICHKCQVRFKSDDVKVKLIELRGTLPHHSDKDLKDGMSQSDTERPLSARPFTIWIAGIHECPGCGFKIVKIRDRRPLRTIIDKDFKEVLARVQTESDKTIVYTGAGE